MISSRQYKNNISKDFENKRRFNYNKYFSRFFRYINSDGGNGKHLYIFGFSAYNR